MSFKKFAALESLPYTLYKHLYVDICDGDLLSGILLSRIVYWFGCSERTGDCRASFKHDGKNCLVKQRSEWWDECRISEKQWDRASSELKKLGFITVEIHKSPFHTGETAAFIFVNEEKIIQAVNDELQGGNPESPKGEFRNPPKGDSRIAQTSIPSISKTFSLDIQEQTTGAVVCSSEKAPEKDPQEKFIPDELKHEALAGRGLSNSTIKSLKVHSLQQIKDGIAAFEQYRQDRKVDRPEAMLATAIREAWTVNVCEKATDDEYLKTLKYLDGKTVGPVYISVGREYIEFSSGSSNKHYTIGSKDFKKNVKEYLEKLKEYKSK